MAGRIAYYGGIVTNGLVLDLDAAKKDSYLGSGTLWNNLTNTSSSGSLINTTFENNNGGGIILTKANGSGLLTNFTNTPNNSTNAVWYKWDGTNYNEVITYLGGSGGTGLGFQISNLSFGAGNRVSVLYGGITTNATGTAGTLVSGVYTHLVITRDGTTTTLYQDGAFVGSTASTPNSSTTLLALGINPGGIGGTVSNILFYNRALSATEVLQNYNALKGRYGL